MELVRGNIVTCVYKLQGDEIGQSWGGPVRVYAMEGEAFTGGGSDQAEGRRGSVRSTICWAKDKFRQEWGGAF